MMLRLLICATLIAALSCAPSGSEHLRQADELSRAGRYEEAIEAYRKHMQYRLAVTERPEWENPYFYLLLIGDEYLYRREPEKALESYEEAEQRGVTPTLTSDRYRAVARWYEEQGELRRALDVLTRFRDRDSLLFDAMADRVARSLTESENGELHQANQQGNTASAGAPATLRDATPQADRSLPPPARFPSPVPRSP